MKTLNKSQIEHLIKNMRKSTYTWRGRYKAFDRAKVKTGEFSTGKPIFGWTCAICGQVFKKKDVVADHILPVVPLEGYESGMEFDANEYVARLLCEESGFQIICKEDHNAKTYLENQLRKEFKEGKKNG